MFSLTQPGATTRLILENGLARKKDLVGCTIDEIKQIEDALELRPLPAAYRQFMMEVGHCAGRFAKGEHLFFPLVLEVREIAFEDHATHGTVRLDHEHVFYQHECYEFYFFDLSVASDDPPVVMRWERSNGQPVCIDESFSQFIVDWVRAERGVYEKIKPDKWWHVVYEHLRNLVR